MKLLADENIGKSIVDALRKQHDVLYLAEHTPRGLPDGAVIRLSQEQNRAILTNDKDFVRLVALMHFPYGVFLLRFNEKQPSFIAPHIAETITTMSKKVKGAIIILSEKNVTVRRYL